MKKFLFAILLSLLCPQLVPAQQVYTARIIDAETGEPLPCVSIYVSEGRATLTNDEGDFALKMEPEDIMHIRCVGYYSQALKAANLANFIRLKPLAIDLREVTVRPDDDDKLLSKVVARLKKDYKKGRKDSRQYFSRSVVVNKDSTNAEMLEAIMDIGSAVNLHDFMMRNGKLSQDKADEWEDMAISTTNIHHLMEVAPMVCASNFWDQAVFPLNDLKANSQYYDISSVFITGENGERICRINMFYNGRKLEGHATGTPVLSGSLYVDAATYRLLRFDGHFETLYMKVFGETKALAEGDNHIHMEFRHKNGYTEVAHSAQHLTTQKLTVRSIVFNVDEMEFPQLEGRRRKRQRKAVGEDFKGAISTAGFDSIMWEHSGIVKRTANEERLVFGEKGGVPAIKKRRLPTPDTVSVADARLKALRDNLWAFAQKRPQEKVFLHMDNTSYFQGDTIWFAAYTQRTDFSTPSNISHVLYAELYDNDGFLVERKIINMKKGWGRGHFVLERPIQHSGFYELRAYTRWQLNWGCFEHKHGFAASEWFLSKELEKNYYRDYEKLYSRVFPVYDRPKVKGDYSRNMTLRPMMRYYRRDPNRRKPLLSLFPEGGNLVAGIPNRVAFEAAWSDGEQMEGSLMLGSEEIPAVNRGRGVFTITPERDMEREVTFTTKDGKKVSAKLPKPERQGASLSVKQAGDDWIIRVQTTGLDPDSLALTVMHEGVMEKFAELDSQYIIHNSQLDAGIHQVTVFDTQGRVWADRLFFVTKPELAKPTLTVSGLKDEYRPYEKIELAVQAPLPEQSPGKNGATGDPMEGTEGRQISLSVRDGYQQDQLFDNGNIMTEMLLASELKGFIPNPGWYFEKYDEEHRLALDLLMMTQGWRRFDWREMAVEGEWKQTQPREKAQILQGIILNFDPNSLRHEERELRRARKYSFARGDLSLGNEHVEPLRVEDEEGVPRIDIQSQEDRMKTLRATAARRKQTEYVLTSQMMTPNGSRRYSFPELRVSDRHFQIQLPLFYGDYIFRARAKKYKRYEANENNGNWFRNDQWTKLDILNERNDLKTKRVIKKKKRLGLEIDDNNNLVLIDRPWPRFVKPYTYYQTHLSDSPDRTMMGPALLADSIHQLREVPISARFGGLRRFDDSQPAFKLTSDEAETMMTDAGIILYMPDRLGRTLFGDMGLAYPYVYAISEKSVAYKTSQMKRRYALTEEQRIIRQLDSIPHDSMYYPKYLRSFPESHPAFQHIDYDKPESYVVYTDYSPRLEGDHRYWGSNLPEVFVVYYPYEYSHTPDRFTYRKGNLPGFARPAQFYSPDYSKQTPPEPSDYRRTLYWNPSVQLDGKGEARITLWNNSRTTHPQVEAAGQASDGTLLWNKQ